jgi:hypothetical protein
MIRTPEQLEKFGELLADVTERIELFMFERPDRFQRSDLEGIVSAGESGLTIRVRDWDNNVDNDFISFDDLFSVGWKERAQQARDEAKRLEEQRRLDDVRRSSAIREANERELYERLKQKFGEAADS